MQSEIVFVIVVILRPEAEVHTSKTKKALACCWSRSKGYKHRLFFFIRENHKRLTPLQLSTYSSWSGFLL